MEMEDLEIVQLELKYCEYCGGLWLRPKGDVEIYCAVCAPYVARFALSHDTRAKPRLPIKRTVCIEGCDGEVLVCGKGGNA